MSVLSGRFRKKGLQAVSNQRDSDGGTTGNVQFGVHLPRGTDNRLRERYDVIFYGHALHVYRDGMNPQDFLCKGLTSLALV